MSMSISSSSKKYLDIKWVKSKSIWGSLHIQLYLKLTYYHPMQHLFPDSLSNEFPKIGQTNKKLPEGKLKVTQLKKIHSLEIRKTLK